jgi:fluoroacetyl-CoA thioesterase
VKLIFKPGDKKQIVYTVLSEDVAAFKGNVVHAVCATFTLAREIEWATRQFVLEMRDDDEEGIGTYLTIEHKGPAYVGEQLVVEAWVDKVEGNELICSYQAKVNDRLIATGKTGQKILKREKLKKLFAKHDE